AFRGERAGHAVELDQDAAHARIRVREVTRPGVVEHLHSRAFGGPIQAVDQSSPSSHRREGCPAPEREFAVDLERLPAELGRKWMALSLIQCMMALLFRTTISHRSGSVRFWVMRAMSSKNFSSV